ncbi:MAG: hypothetical protein C4522_02705 [Desulfobacteraceae bacterium]|nr:MAG: hypothetical protein C4522_02705 [Desulfobacteraceae bacterium]
MKDEKEIVTNGVRLAGVFGKLNITCRFATIYNPCAKPIERVFKNVVQPQFPDSAASDQGMNKGWNN